MMTYFTPDLFKFPHEAGYFFFGDRYAASNLDLGVDTLFSDHPGENLGLICDRLSEVSGEETFRQMGERMLAIYTGVASDLADLENFRRSHRELDDQLEEMIIGGLSELGDDGIIALNKKIQRDSSQFYSFVSELPGYEGLFNSMVGLVIAERSLLERHQEPIGQFNRMYHEIYSYVHSSERDSSFENGGELGKFRDYLLEGRVRSPRLFGRMMNLYELVDGDQGEAQTLFDRKIYVCDSLRVFEPSVFFQPYVDLLEQADQIERRTAAASRLRQSPAKEVFGNLRTFISASVADFLDFFSPSNQERAAKPQ
ncbi:hypothetical protein HOC01_05930 [archaeon]|nr:hypothetical protein [archaeon]MBT6697618.1 hypothetical protein [archaeon]